LLSAQVLSPYVKFFFLTIAYCYTKKIDSNIHLIRHSVFAVLSLVAYFLPPLYPPSVPASVAYLAPVFTQIAQHQDRLLSRLRAVSLQRITVLRDGHLRDKVRAGRFLLCVLSSTLLNSYCLQSVAFWAAAEQESKYAAEDPDVAAIRSHLGLAPGVKTEDGLSEPSTETPERARMAAWIESALAPPTPPAP
jgi:hypothetical protein